MARFDRRGERHPVVDLHTGRPNDEGLHGSSRSLLAKSQAGSRGRRGDQGVEGRALRLGVVTGYPTEDPSSRGLLHACRALGETWALSPASLSIEVGEERVEVCFAGWRASSFDALVLLRGVGPAGDEDAQLMAYRLAEEEGILVINALDALLAAQDKLRTSVLLRRAGVPTPAVVVVQDADQLDEVLERLGTAVAKPQWGSLGIGVERLPGGRAGRRRAAQLLEEQGAVHLQAYVDHGGRDLRVFVVGGVVQAAIERLAPADDFRTNFEVGGSVRPVALGEELEAIALRAAATLGLDWAGIDIAVGPEGPMVIEVNGSPGWQGIHQASGADMGEAIAQHVARRALQSIEHGARQGRG